MGINVLSLFGGIECGKVALDRLGIKVDKYFSSEIDEYAIKIASKNHPDIIHIGDIKDIWYSDEHGTLITKVDAYKVDIDMVIGGPPCQDLSAAKANRKGLEGEKSSLFYEYVRVLKEIKPKYFLMENVASMKNDDRDTITETLKEIYPDVQVYMIDSSKVSGQKRKRYYWTNIQGVVQRDAATRGRGF